MKLAPSANLAPRAVSLIGVPTDIGAGTMGARMGPEALRVASIAQAIAQFGIDVKDCGNLLGPANPWQEAVNGFRHLPEVAQWNQTLHDAVYAELQQQRLPILLGGDHSLAIGSISAVARHCREQGKSCGSCGLTRTPISTPQPSHPAATSTACRWPACAAMARPSSPA